MCPECIVGVAVILIVFSPLVGIFVYGRIMDRKTDEMLERNYQEVEYYNKHVYPKELEEWAASGKKTPIPVPRASMGRRRG